MARILIVDDDENILRLYGKYLSDEDHEVLTSTNAVDGLDCLYKHTTDLALIDANMPQMSGFELLERLRRSPRFKTLPLALFTARHAKSDIERAIRLGANDYIVKPINKENFIQKVNKLVPKVSYSDAMTVTFDDPKNMPQVEIPLICRLCAVSDYAISIESNIKLKLEECYSVAGEFLEEHGLSNCQFELSSLVKQDSDTWKMRLKFLSLSERQQKKLTDWIILRKQIEKKAG